jgi:hypothetical protein
MHDTFKNLSGYLQIIRKNKLTGELDKIITLPNLITYDATNLLARSIAGQAASYINKVAIQYYTDAGAYTDNDPPGFNPAATDRISDLTIDNSNVAYFELPILSTSFTGLPTEDAASTIQTSNVITFYSAIDDDNGTEMQNKFMVGAGLLGVSNGSQLLFSHQYIPLIQKLEFYQLLINWSVRFS